MVRKESKLNEFQQDLKQQLKSLRITTYEFRTCYDPGFPANSNYLKIILNRFVTIGLLWGIFRCFSLKFLDCTILLVEFY